MTFVGLFSFMVLIASGGVNTTISGYTNVDINSIDYYEYEYEYENEEEENRTITILGINTFDLDISCDLYNYSTYNGDYSATQNGDRATVTIDFDMNSFVDILDDFRTRDYELFETFILEEKRLSFEWFYAYLDAFYLSYYGNSYSIVPVDNDVNNSAYQVLIDYYFYFDFDFGSFGYSFEVEEYELLSIDSVNGFNVGMSFIVQQEDSQDFNYEKNNDDTNSYYNSLYDRGNENGLFQGRQEGFTTGYNDAIMSQPSSVLELVTKPFVEMGKFLNISIAPNLTIGMIIAIPIIIAVVGFLIKALIA